MLRMQITSIPVEIAYLGEYSGDVARYYIVSTQTIAPVSNPK
jgi:hypothetical protein